MQTALVVLVVGLGVAGLLRPRWLRPAAFALGAGITAWAITRVLKPVIGREGPGGPLEAADGSFPQGPGAAAVAIAVAIWPTSRRLALIFAAIALVDGIAEVAAGWHWPSDVLAAWAVGAATGIAARRLAGASPGSSVPAGRTPP